MSGVDEQHHRSLSFGQTDSFADRHIGLSVDEQAKMLAAIGYDSLDDLAAAAVPADIRYGESLHLPPAATEAEVARELREIANRNQVLTSMIGLGYYGTITPAVIRRNVLENPAWYTAYTPYQAEISQGRLEALLNFQTVISDLTGLPVANASLLDEATAAAEAMVLCARVTGREIFVVDAECFPQTIAVLQTRADALNIEIVVCDTAAGLPAGELAGVLLQCPGSSGLVSDYSVVVAEAHERGALAVVAADLLALTVLRPPGDMGADIALGSSQRFGMPMGFGGPHAAYFAVRTELQRNLPGRLVGISRDAAGQPAYRLALQTREQHIRRAKATSNVCTAQVLPAVVAAMYAVWHGPDGLTAIASRVHRYASVLAAGLQSAGTTIVHQQFFDTVLVQTPGHARAIVSAAAKGGVNLRWVDDDHIAMSCDETTQPADLLVAWQGFGIAEHTARVLAEELDNPDSAASSHEIPPELRRSSAFLTHPVFHERRTETAMLRYLRRLSDRDLALDRTMIPLGSCTMKLNATTEMESITWPGFAELHPFAPRDQAVGYAQLIEELAEWLGRITGFEAVSLQPTAGSQGELAGLFAIRAYHRARGDENRIICLIPESAHGTNPASATLAGMTVVPVKCQSNGDVDRDDLRATVEKYDGAVAALMITYPSTNGIFEPQIAEICELVHQAGGQVYADGANLNAMVGLARPGDFGADVCHVNLHKTFCIPHGGGGPGVGPVCAKAHLAPYLPTHQVASQGTSEDDVGPVSAAPWGSASILPVSWAYIRLMGADGLRYASQCAILAANYVARRLGSYYQVLFSGQHGLVAHECIVDLRPITASTGITAEDVAKRLIDYGFHAPTMSFPVAGTLMIEPTESENLAELDRFCRAMIAIRAEIDSIAAGDLDAADNPLKNAPHTATMVVGDWSHPYSRDQAVYPVPEVAADKYWPPVRRVDNAYGDRHLVCSCPPVSSYSELTV